MLIFSKNDIPNAIALIKDLYGIADEAVLIDSSNRESRDLVAKERKRLGLRKLRVFETVALGYPDPLRMYGLKKCSNNWVLLLDTDEKLSPALKAGIKNLIDDSGQDAFAIKRHEGVGKKNDKLFTWQVRLFRKANIRYKGLRDEQAIVSGRLKSLKGKEYYIEHHGEISGHTGRQSGKMELYDERLTYNLYNRKLMEYFGKLSTQKNSPEKTKTGKLLKRMLLLYEKAGSKKPGDEVSTFDYLMFNVFKDIGFTMMGRNPINSLTSVPDRFNDVRRMREWKRAENSKEALEISKIINDIGVTKFLKLDQERTIRRLNRLYKDKNEGITLLIYLLEQEYRKSKAKRKKG